MKKQVRGSLILLLTAMIWGSAFVAQSEGAEYVGPFTYNAARNLLGGLVLLPVLAAFRYAARKRGDAAAPNRRTTILGGICCGTALAVAGTFQQAGVARTTAGKAGFITALYVVIVPVLSLFLRKKPPRLIWLCIAVAVFGFYLLCMQGGFSIGAGDLLVLCCAVCFAVHILVIDHFSRAGADAVAMSCVQFFTAAVVMTVGMLLFEQPEWSQVVAARSTILYAGIVSSGVAYTLQIFGQRDTTPTAATLLMSLESVFAALAGWLLLHEQLSGRELMGCGLVFAAVVAAQLLPEPQYES